jgi:hypothetical protein
MTNDLKRFIIRISGITTVILLTGWLVFSLFIPQFYLRVFPLLLGLFIFTSIIIHAYRLKVREKSLSKFFRNNILITFFKITLFTVFTVVYIANNTENALAFVIVLFILYMIFTFIEVLEINKIAKNPKN